MKKKNLRKLRPGSLARAVRIARCANNSMMDVEFTDTYLSINTLLFVVALGKSSYYNEPTALVMRCGGLGWVFRDSIEPVP